MVRARDAILLATLGCGCGCGCAAPRAAVEPATPDKAISVAVIGFGGTDQLGSAAEDGCVMAVLETGLRAIERRQVVAALPNEADVDFSTVGRALGADLIIDGGVARGSGDERASLEPRLISTHSVNVLGVAKSTGRVKLTRAVGRRVCTQLLAQLP